MSHTLFLRAAAVCLLAPAAAAQMPLGFEPNAGQAPAAIAFLAHAGNETIRLTRDGVAVGAVQIRFASVSPQASTEPGDALPGRANYLHGRDPGGWITGVPTYSAVRYRNLYPGIDLLCHGDTGQFEYDFVLAPGADPHRIRLSFPGADSVRVDRSGDLVVAAAGSEQRQRLPRIYQGAQTIAGRFARLPDGAFGFDLGPYDRSRELVIDPVVTYGSYFGGGGIEAMALDAAGNIYLAGSTKAQVPTTSGSYQPNPHAACASQPYMGGTLYYYCRDVFVAKLNPQGTSLLFSTYIGGMDDEDAGGIAVDAAGNVYVAGVTDSPDFPVTANAFQGKLAGGELNQDAFLVQLDPTGSKLLYSTFIGGKGDDSVRAMALAPSGDLYLAGSTTSPNFPVLAALQAQFGGGDCSANFSNELNCSDAFVMRWRTRDMSLQYSTFLGGNGDDFANGLALDAQQNIYVAGSAKSADFPLANPLPFAPAAGAAHAFVAKIAAAGNAFVYSTLLGGSRTDSASAIAVDGAGNAVVAGSTASPDFPLANAFESKPGGGICYSIAGILPNPVACAHGFVSRLNATGSALIYSTYLGGNGSDQANAIALDAAGNAWIAGTTSSRTGFPVTPDALHFCNSAAVDVIGGSGFLTNLKADGTLAGSSFYGGTGYDGIGTLLVDPAGNLWIAGATGSTDLPLTAGAFQTKITYLNSTGYFAKIDPRAAPSAGPVIDSTCILNAAAFQSYAGFGAFAGAIAPGEIVAIFGSGMGPAAGVTASAPAGGSFPTSLGGVSVTFNGTPAPLLYAQSNQINAVVPFGIATGTQAPVQVQVRYAGATSPVATVTAATLVPGIFTVGSTGMGQAAALNQDGTLNSPANPALRGSIVSIWATGVGALAAPLRDGQIAQGPPPLLAATPSVYVGPSLLAEVQYAGQAPEMVAGAIQINVVIPADTPPGPMVPIYVYEGYQRATIAVK